MLLLRAIVQLLHVFLIEVLQVSAASCDPLGNTQKVDLFLLFQILRLSLQCGVGLFEDVLVQNALLSHLVFYKSVVILLCHELKALKNLL